MINNDKKGCKKTHTSNPSPIWASLPSAHVFEERSAACAHLGKIVRQSVRIQTRIDSGSSLTSQHLGPSGRSSWPPIAESLYVPRISILQWIQHSEQGWTRNNSTIKSWYVLIVNKAVKCELGIFWPALYVRPWVSLSTEQEWCQIVVWECWVLPPEHNARCISMWLDLLQMTQLRNANAELDSC
jgi:hypothetical protein